MSTDEVDLTILIPCFNEEDHIEATLTTVAAAVKATSLICEIIVVDDKSTDRTFEAAQNWIKTHPGYAIHLRRNEKNRGLSRTFVDGAFVGGGKYYRLVCGDNAEPKETIVKILSRIGDADMIIPYHTVVQGKGPLRLFFSKTYTWLVNLVSGYRLKYYNGCALHLRYNVMRWGAYSFGFGFQAELITRLLDEGATYIEIPVEAAHQEKDARASALNWKNFLSVAHTLLEMSVRRIRRHLYGP